MPIVGGLDIHRKQMTFDYLDTVTGAVERGQITPADRQHLARGWRRGSSLAARTRISRWRAVLGGGTSPRNWPRPGSPRTWANRPRPRSRAARRGVPRPTGPTPGCSGTAGGRAGCPSAGSRRPHPGVPGAAGALPRPAHRAHRLGAAHPRECASTKAPRSCPGTARAPAGARCARPPPRTCRRPASCRWPPPWTCWMRWKRELDTVRRRLLATARHLTGARALASQLYGVGPDHRAGADLLAGRRRPVLLRPQGGPVRRPGHHRALLRRQALPRAAVPAGPAKCCAGAVRGRQDPRPPPAPGHGYYARSRTATTVSAPACPRPAGSSGRPATSWPSSATTRSPPC